VNWNHKARKILITGKSGSGKTTLFLQTLRDWPARWKFVFDPEREAARKLRWPVSVNLRQMSAAAAAQQPVCFDPTAMFPGDRAGGFAFFCRWTLNVARLVSGPKVLAVDEIQNYTLTGREGIPQSIRELLDLGRREEVDLLVVSQRPNELNHAIRSQLTSVVTYQHTDRLPLEWLYELGFDRAEVFSLAYPGGRIERNLLNGETKRFAPNAARKGSPRKAVVR